MCPRKAVNQVTAEPVNDLTITVPICVIIPIHLVRGIVLACVAGRAIAGDLSVATVAVIKPVLSMIIIVGTVI